MDDRFDRRELLLHLGDVLEAISCVAKAGKPAAPVTELAKTEESLQEFVFLKALAPTLTAAEFEAEAASTFFLWPKELLEEPLNHRALAAMVQHDLFEGNPDGWNAYVAELQKKVTRFGAELPKMQKASKPREAHNTREEPNPVEASVAPAGPAAEWGTSDGSSSWQGAQEFLQTVEY